MHRKGRLFLYLISSVTMIAITSGLKYPSVKGKGMVIGNGHWTHFFSYYIWNTGNTSSTLGAL